MALQLNPRQPTTIFIVVDFVLGKAFKREV
jgi:hypothetical protein